ncbi:DUF2690 domain-containing protein [Streptomyces sp. NPDC101150]|uniref:DUF2690 domain-containing protein n=1 Tax=Streptomyces sp. NPDC101150 TaxID=3366114 RepID=UPI0038260194
MSNHADEPDAPDEPDEPTGPGGGADPAPDPDPDQNTDAHPHPSLLQRVGARIRAVGRRLRAHARHALVVGVVTAVLGPLAGYVVPKLLEDPPPPAPSCPGAGCDGKSPKDSGCAADVVTWEPAEGNVARIQLRYSKKCGAVWGRIVNGEPGDMVTVSVAGGSSHSASIDINHDKYTTMAWVGDTFRVRFCAVPGSTPGHTGAWVKYCFEATEHAEWD